MKQALHHPLAGCLVAISTSALFWGAVIWLVWLIVKG